MASARAPLSRISPVMLIVASVLFIAVVVFLTRWYEFAAACALSAVLAVLGRAGWRFWRRYLKVALPLVVLSVFFNWLVGLPGGIRVLWPLGDLFKSSENIEPLWKALVIGGRFALAVYFSMLLVHICTHEELVWGLARLSERLFRRPVVGQVLALALLSVPFYLESLSRVRRWSEVPKAVARVLGEAQTLVSHPVEITGKQGGWLLFAVGVVCLAAAVVVG